LISLLQYLVIGHVTKDVQPDESFRIGGTATYSALAAAQLGLSVGVLTSIDGAIEPFERNPSIIVGEHPAKNTTVFENIYSGRHRKQYIRAMAEVLTVADLLPGWNRAPIVHLGPVCQEVADDLVDAFPGSLLGVTPQGFLRRWDQDGLVSPVEWAHADHVLEVADVVVLSLQDVGGDRERLERYVRRAKLLVLTLGEDGAIVHRGGASTRVPAYEVVEADPTGAGDVFAAGFLIRYHETADPLEAARFANCAASFCVEGIGASNLPTREQVEWRMRHGRLRP
jgi:hypothetical protein